MFDILRTFAGQFASGFEDVFTNVLWLEIYIKKLELSAVGLQPSMDKNGIKTNLKFIQNKARLK